MFTAEPRAGDEQCVCQGACQRTHGENTTRANTRVLHTCPHTRPKRLPTCMSYTRPVLTSTPMSYTQRDRKEMLPEGMTLMKPEDTVEGKSVSPRMTTAP